jgi:putative ABC transport system substrate-binding protein
VASLARPGGNLTGLYVREAELAAKRIEMAREALPKMRRLALWWDSLSHDSEALAAAAKASSLEVGFVGVAGQPPDYDAALRLSARLNADAVLLTASPTYLQARSEIMRLALKARVPVIAAFRECATAGALLSYGIDLPSIFQDIAITLDRIARGAKPADVPIGRPARFELVVNLKTAKALGLTLPDSLLSRVDQVIA